MTSLKYLEVWTMVQEKILQTTQQPQKGLLQGIQNKTQNFSPALHAAMLYFGKMPLK